MKKVKVFISSTFKDLEHYRTEVDKTIRVLDSESISMEHFGSDHRQPLEVCLAAIEDCDLFVGIYGLRYGFTPPRQSLSITELEYNHAITQGKPILAFISEDTIQYEKDYVSEAVSTDSAEVLKLKSFKDRIRLERVIREFVTKDELGKYMAIELGKYYIKIIRGQTLSNPLTHLPLPNDIYYPTGSPYVGLRCFSRREAKVFYGRNQLIFDLYQKLHQPEPIILVYGQTGVGKSSVLDAGLLPRLEKQNWLIFLLKRLYEQGLPNQLNIILKELKQSDENHLLIIDQVEELWTNPNPQLKTEKEDFFKIIYSLLEPYDKNFKIILSFRKEFLAEVRDALTGLPYLEQMVKPMNQPELIEAITQIYQDKDAFKRYHIKVSEELPHEIAYDLRKDEKSHLAPLLQATLSQMWEFASKTGFEEEISFDHKLYNQVKTESLEGFLKAQLNKIGESYPESLENGLLLDILNQFTTDLGTSAQHSLTELNERYSHIANLNDILIAFENKYLLLKNDKQTFKLSHDSLAPLVQKAFRTSDAAGQKAARILGSKDLSQEVDEYFTEAELEVLKKGIYGMRELIEIEEKSIDKTNVQFIKRKKLIEEQSNAIIQALSNSLLKNAEIYLLNKSYSITGNLLKLYFEINDKLSIQDLNFCEFLALTTGVIQVDACNTDESDATQVFYNFITSSGEMEIFKSDGSYRRFDNLGNLKAFESIFVIDCIFSLHNNYLFFGERGGNFGVLELTSFRIKITSSLNEFINNGDLIISIFHVVKNLIIIVFKKEVLLFDFELDKIIESEKIDFEIEKVKFYYKESYLFLISHQGCWLFYIDIGKEISEKYFNLVLLNLSESYDSIVGNFTLLTKGATEYFLTNLYPTRYLEDRFQTTERINKIEFTKILKIENSELYLRIKLDSFQISNGLKRVIESGELQLGKPDRAILIENVGILIIYEFSVKIIANGLVLRELYLEEEISEVFITSEKKCIFTHKNSFTIWEYSIINKEIWNDEFIKKSYSASFLNWLKEFDSIHTDLTILREEYLKSCEFKYKPLSYRKLLNLKINEIELACKINRFDNLLSSQVSEMELYHYARYYFEIARTIQGDLREYCQKSLMLYDKLIVIVPLSTYVKERDNVYKLLNSINVLP